jgi:hypothetical protein
MVCSIKAAAFRQTVMTETSGLAAARPLRALEGAAMILS